MGGSPCVSRQCLVCLVGMEDDGRLQVDVRGLPLGVKPALRSMAFEAGVSFTEYVRRLLVAHAMGGSSPLAQAPLPQSRPSGWEPVR